MKKVLSVVAFGFVLVFVFTLTGYAQPGRFGLSGKASTLGVGAEATVQVIPNVFGRLGVNGFQYDYDGSAGDVDYDFELKLFTVSLLADWHPFNGVFRVTGGFLVNQNEVDADSRPTDSFTIGDTTYPSALVGTLNGTADFNSIAPYAGIGWSNAFKGDNRWGFFLDLGVMFQGSPDVELSSDGPLAATPAFQADLAREEQELEDELDKFQYYPVVAFGVTYRF